MRTNVLLAFIPCLTISGCVVKAPSSCLCCAHNAVLKCVSCIAGPVCDQPLDAPHSCLQYISLLGKSMPHIRAVVLNMQHKRQQLCHVLIMWQDFDFGRPSDKSVLHDSQAGDAHIMCHWVLHLLQTYSSYNRGRRSVQTAASLRQDAVGESYRYTLP